MRTPNAQQLKAINHDSGPALVLAGPGSGKTFTIIQHIHYLIHTKKIPPEEILVVTFSKAAAQEMQTRYQESVDSVYLENPIRFGTFHSLGYQILSSTAQFKNFSLISEKQKYHILEVLLKNQGFHAVCTHEKETILLNYFASKKSDADVGGALELLDAPELDEEELFRVYQNYLEEKNLLDFDDLILKCNELFRNGSHVLERYQKMFTHILVDEFQDINASQYELITALAKPQNELYVVGDDDQSIYGFRGSKPGIMQEFMTHYTDVRRYDLTSNFRSGQRIVSISRKMIEQNKERFQKEFVPEKDGGEVRFHHLATRKDEEILLLQELQTYSMDCLDRTAVIVRTNLEAGYYASLLRRNHIPVMEIKRNAGGTFHSEVAEDLYTFLRFLYEGHHRKDFMKIMNKPERDITREALTSEVVSEEELLRYYTNHREMVIRIRKLFQLFGLAEHLQPHLAIQLFRKEMEYDRYLKKRNRSYAAYEEDLKRAQEIQDTFRDYRREMPLDEFLTVCREKENKEQTVKKVRGVQVMTMHASKGLEFDHVYLPDLNEGIIPPKGVLSEQQLEEERRLLYVAVTRAREKLFLYETRERNRQMTRFLNGITAR